MGIFVRDDRLRSGWRVTFYLLVYLFGMLVSQMVVLGAYSTALLLRGQATMAELTQRLIAIDLPLWLFTALKAVDVAWMLLLTGLFGRFIDRRRFAEFGLGPADGWRGDAILGLALGTVQMIAIVVISWLAGCVRFAMLPNPLSAFQLQYAALGLLLFVLVAVGEELLFRGYVQTNLQEGAGPAVALGVTSVLFGLFHALNPNQSWFAMLNLILAGVALGMGYWATGSLWLPMAYHLSWNFVQGSILGLPVSGMRYGGLIIVADWGKAPWLTGHAFGPEGGLLGTAMLLITIGLFWSQRQQRVSAPGHDV